MSSEHIFVIGIWLINFGYIADRFDWENDGLLTQGMTWSDIWRTTALGIVLGLVVGFMLNM